ncbi:Aspartyl protease [Clostridium cavendishii DSM 21758]|uniref:Aspartyl protease n=1 Tax=Clostridium cavendishii DSM 21758 TaxID=1121302 RepID=A0A1M6SJJ5_9CLOT|nr:retropepsin-like aspartic protease [Clostridium cavendishii]SHK44912.1 Aspartyl protease [Clostridium cavendishii DSM 21758]
MHKVQFKNGLIYTSITLTHEDKSIVIDDVIIDTGASHTIIVADFLENMDVSFSEEDKLVKASGYGGTVCYSVRKRIDSITCGDIKLDNLKIDFGEIDPNERVNGLLGLDFCIKAGVVIDLVDLAIIKKAYEQK